MIRKVFRKHSSPIHLLEPRAQKTRANQRLFPKVYMSMDLSSRFTWQNVHLIDVGRKPEADDDAADGRPNAAECVDTTEISQSKQLTHNCYDG